MRYSGFIVYVLNTMNSKWLLLLTALLLLSFCFNSAGDNKDIGDQAIVSGDTEQPVLLVSSQAAVPSDSIASNNQIITLKDPTFKELRDFILRDTTSRNKYVLNVYECRHFASEVDNNAQAAGWRCGFALICYARGQHAVVAFNTTDRGLIFIEPQTDAVINVKVGGTYEGKEIIEILIAW